MDSSIYGEKVKILLKEVIEFLNSNSEIVPVLIIDNDNVQQNKSVNYLKEQLNRDCIVYKHENIWDTTALLSQLDLVLTNKLHVGIVSYALGTNCIGIPYHPKTTRFYKQINQSELCIPLLEIKENDVYKCLCDSKNKEWKEELNNRREKIYPELRKKSLKNKELMKEFLLDR